MQAGIAATIKWAKAVAVAAYDTQEYLDNLVTLRKSDRLAWEEETKAWARERKELLEKLEGYEAKKHAANAKKRARAKKGGKNEKEPPV